MSAWVWALAAVAALLLVWVTMLVATRIRRLDRLHVRTDAARAALESALERRAAAALAVAAVLAAAGHREPAEALRGAVAGARAARVAGEDREGAENVLGRALVALDRSTLGGWAVDRSLLPDAVLEELVYAEQLLVLARHVHNDAVRDTRRLRSRRLVRRLHLAGTARMPEYFEIADPEPGAVTAARTPSPGVTRPAPLRRPVAPPA